jgi:hypothetical protein
MAKTFGKKYLFGNKEYTCDDLLKIAWEKQGRIYTYVQLYSRIKRLGVDEAVNGYNKKKKCECGCGEEFKPVSSIDRRKYFDKDRCRRRHLKNLIIRGQLKPSQINTCVTCKKKFPIFKQIGMPADQKFCCDDCRSEHHSIMMRKNKGETKNAYSKPEERWEGLDDKPRDYNLALV